MLDTIRWFREVPSSSLGPAKPVARQLEVITTRLRGMPYNPVAISSIPAKALTPARETAGATAGVAKQAVHVSDFEVRCTVSGGSGTYLTVMSSTAGQPSPAYKCHPRQEAPAAKPLPRARISATLPAKWHAARRSDGA